MERRTVTTLGQLRVGDWFYFTGDPHVWQVKRQEAKSTFINYWDSRGMDQLRFPEKKNGTRQVTFLRHGIPVAGEASTLQDLQDGDVFCTVTEPGRSLTIKKSANRMMYWVYVAEDAEGNILQFEPNTEIIFIRSCKTIPVV